VVSSTGQPPLLLMMTKLYIQIELLIDYGCNSGIG
jgi:hypothetical protein